MSSIYVTIAADSGDIALNSKRQFFLLFGGDAIVQNIQERLKMFMGEWFLDLADGVPYYRDFLGQKGSSKSVMRSVLKDRIAGTPGVLKVLAVDINLDRRTRELTVTFKAQIAEPTSQGLLVVDGVTFLLDGSGNILTTGGDSLTV